MPPQSQFLLYSAPDGAVKVDVFFQDETVSLTHKALTEPFGVQRPAVHTLIAVAMLWLGALSPLHAEDKPRGPAPVCYVADEKKTLPATIVSLPTILDHYPTLDHDSDNAPAQLRWGPMPAGTTVTTKVMGRFHGREIHLATYMSTTAWGKEFDLALLTLDDQPYRTGKELRPIFLLPGSEVRWFDICTVSSDGCPFGIEIEQTLKGSGDYMSTWLLKLTDSGARLVERTDGGRGMEQKTQRYK